MSYKLATYLCSWYIIIMASCIKELSELFTQLRIASTESIATPVLYQLYSYRCLDKYLKIQSQKNNLSKYSGGQYAPTPKVSVLCRLYVHSYSNMHTKLCLCRFTRVIAVPSAVPVNKSLLRACCIIYSFYIINYCADLNRVCTHNCTNPA